MALRNFINACISEEDYLGYLPYIEAFEYLIWNHEELMTLPIVFGIHGKWGVGKSTFMALIRSRLDKTNSFFTIDINPWEYGEEQNFVSVFLAKLYEGVRDQLSNEELGLKDDITAFFKSMFKPLKLTTNIGLFKGEYDFSKLNFDTQKDIIDEFISENFLMKEVIHKILNAEIFTKKKIVIFIDDLDRCRTEKVMQVIESIKLILNSTNCIFFIGCDKNYLENALSVTYKNFIEFLVEERHDEETNGNDLKANYKLSLKSFSREYLEKIIQVPFNIPPLDKDSIQVFVDCILHNRGNVAVVQNQTSVDFYDMFCKEINQSLITSLVVQANLNPRRIKRILNLLFLNYLFIQYKFKNSKNTLKNLDINILTLLSFIRDLDQEFYNNYLSIGSMCKIVLLDFYLLYKQRNKNEEDDEIDNTNKSYLDNEEIYDYIKTFFEETKIKSISDLKKRLTNIDIYISVSNTTTFSDYSEKTWGPIRNLKSDITSKKLEIFLNRLNNNEVAQDFILWFFQSVYDKEIFSFGLQRNIHVYRRCESGAPDIENGFVLRFEYNAEASTLYIKFQRGKYKSIFLEPIKKINSCKFYDKQNNYIRIDSTLDYKIISDVKKIVEKLMC